MAIIMIHWPLNNNKTYIYKTATEIRTPRAACPFTNGLPSLAFLAGRERLVGLSPPSPHTPYLSNSLVGERSHGNQATKANPVL